MVRHVIQEKYAQRFGRGGFMPGGVCQSMSHKWQERYGQSLGFVPGGQFGQRLGMEEVFCQVVLVKAGHARGKRGMVIGQ